MAGPLATIPDLEARLGSPLTGADLTRATSNIADVSVIVRHVARLDWSLATDPVVPEIAALVVIQAALRAYRNPDGLAGENIAGAYAYTYGPGAQNGVYLTAEETTMVREAAGLEGPGVGGFIGSVRTPSSYERGAADVIYVGDGIPGSEPIPLVELA